jgi:hypothetical protein
MSAACHGLPLLWLYSRTFMKGVDTGEWLAALDDFRNWLAWTCGPRKAMKLVAE